MLYGKCEGFLLNYTLPIYNLTTKYNEKLRDFKALDKVFTKEKIIKQIIADISRAIYL